MHIANLPIIRLVGATGRRHRAWYMVVMGRGNEGGGERPHDMSTSVVG